MQQDKNKTTPLLRWAGSKQKLLPKLAHYWGNGFNRYLEPFAGSAALFFAIQPEKACLNDINSDLIDSYRVLSQSPKKLHYAVKSIPSESEQYYKMRAIDPSALSEFERAVRFVYLNRHCFNGIYRTNSKGSFNVPFGAAGAGAVPSLERFIACSEAISRTKLTSLDFEKFLTKEVRSGDFVSTSSQI